MFQEALEDTFLLLSMSTLRNGMPDCTSDWFNTNERQFVKIASLGVRRTV